MKKNKDKIVKIPKKQWVDFINVIYTAIQHIEHTEENTDIMLTLRQIVGDSFQEGEILIVDGKGGQHRNKHQNCCRCKHPISGAVGSCQEHRSKIQNTKLAFRRMVQSKMFQEWLKVEAARAMGHTSNINNKIDKELIRNIKVEVKHKGKWVEEKEVV